MDICPNRIRVNLHRALFYSTVNYDSVNKHRNKRCLCIHNVLCWRLGRCRFQSTNNPSSKHPINTPHKQSSNVHASVCITFRKLSRNAHLHNHREKNNQVPTINANRILNCLFNLRGFLFYFAMPLLNIISQNIHKLLPNRSKNTCENRDNRDSAIINLRHTDNFTLKHIKKFWRTIKQAIIFYL